MNAARDTNRIGDAGWLEENARRLDAAAQSLARVLEGRMGGEDIFFDGDARLPLTLRHLATRFGLSPFERDLLLLAALIERDSALARLVGRWHGEATRAHANFELARVMLRDADRIALSPSAALRRWRLIDVAPGQPIAQARLDIDERVQFYLEGHSFPDPRLEGLIHPLRAAPRPHRELSPRITALFRGAASPAQCPVVELSGARAAERAAVLAAVCSELRLRPYNMAAADIPAQPSEREALARLWEREAMLLDAALVIDAEDLAGDAAARLVSFLNSLDAIAFVSCRVRLAPLERPMHRCELPSRTTQEEIGRWQAALGPLAQRLDGSVARTAIQFHLDDEALAAVAAAARAEIDVDAAAQVLWDGARVQARHGLETLAERIETRAGWNDLVLPPPQLDMLRSMALHVRERDRVYREWGFADKSARGLGIAALFSGTSGTGKTMAAEILAHDLRLDLYRIDLARLVSKYIGETEKNLARVFDAAEAGGAVLLFDEADALFGKRSEVRDSHDRYANIEVSYLLQRIETYRGLSILTTNMKQALDPAFLRRIRFVVALPFPDGAARRDIWARVFPDAVPREALDLTKLARLNLAGGHIRNIALNAAFLAASQDHPVRMTHLRAAAEAEYAKLEKSLPRAELGDWT